MDRLWTPWRMQYVTGSAGDNDETSRSDIFVAALESADDPDSLVVHRGRYAFVIMNLFPYNTGHMMVVPNRKVQTLDALIPDERAEIMELTSVATEVANRVLRCDGFNIGLNIGAIAGAGIADHLHLHVVPRWTGDANFMPITASTMVLPELLPSTTARLKAEFIARDAASGNPEVHSTAGALVYLPNERKLILRRAKDGTIVLPKGHIETGESAAEAAIREVREETGFASTITHWAGTDAFEHAGRSFHTVYFFATGSWTKEAAEHLATDTLLADLADAEEQVSFPALRALVGRCRELIDRELDREHL